MPITVFDVKGVPGNRRERIEAAVIAGGKRIAGPHEAFIVADPFRGGVKVLITGPHGLERNVTFAFDEDPDIPTAPGLRFTRRLRRFKRKAPERAAALPVARLNPGD